LYKQFIFVGLQLHRLTIQLMSEKVVHVQQFFLLTFQKDRGTIYVRKCRCFLIMILFGVYMYYQDQTRFYCTIMRGGTSKGIFLKENDLPQDPVLRDKVILAIFGSPDKRQIDGLGGADMLTSKLAIISGPTREDADVDYVFGQVEIEKKIIHYDGLCGNISSAVGPYAIEEGLVKAVEPVTKVRVHSRNSRQIFIAEVPVKDGKPLATGDYEIAGVPGTGAKIRIDMASTAGSRTGKALPTGNAVDKVDIPGFGPLDLSLFDVVNPCIFVRAADIGKRGDEKPAETDNDKDFLDLVTKIRIAGARTMGLENWTPEQPLPFVVFVSSPKDYTDHLTGKLVRSGETDFLARMIWLGKMHRTYAGSVSCVTGFAAMVPGSVVNEAAKPKDSQITIRIGHPAGVIEVEAEIERDAGGEIKAKRVTYGRSARRIMDGYVYVPHTVFG
jgi:2-methylaconitate cis-trans-isomerase PrpF